MNHPTFRAACSWLALLGLACSGQQAFAVTYTVGTGVGCDYADIQSAVNATANVSGYNAIFVQETTQTNVHVVVSNQKLYFVGGFKNCTDSAHTSGDVSEFNGQSGHSVIEVQGNSELYVQYMQITGGNTSGGGGGISFEGSGILNVYGSSIYNNVAAYGGGIAMQPSGTATLQLQGVTIADNSVSGEGGGISMSGSTTLYSDSTTYITGNTAGTNGGGIKLGAPATVYISSNLNSNTAAYGGGIAAYSSGSSPVDVHLYSSSNTAWVSIYGNTATELGGGVYIKASNAAPASLCAQDFSIDANKAFDGAAIYADINGTDGAFIDINPSGSTCAGSNNPFPPISCPTGQYCNEIADNVNPGTNGNPGTGATITVAEGGGIIARRFAARRNSAAELIYVDTEENYEPPRVNVAEFHECLMANNNEVFPLIYLYGGGANTQLIVDTCTITNNVVDSEVSPAYTIHAEVNYAQLTNSILYDVGAQVIDFLGPQADDLTVQYVLANNISTLGSALGTIQGAPTFVNAANQDYHLAGTSLGVDYAPSLTDTDLDGNPRPVDLPCTRNVFGPTDLGAYELQSDPDAIFCSGFETSPE